MGSMLTIGQLAQKVEVPTSTLRYYEREGLLQADRRSEGNYRLYSSSSVERLRFIRAAQSTGFTLTDIRALLSFRDGKVAPCREVRKLIELRLGRVEERLAELRQFRKVLKDFAQSCKAAEEEDPCHVMDKLSSPGIQENDRR